MSDIRLETPVGQLVAEHPSWARVFEQHKIDYCCGGKIPLEKACAARHVDPDALLQELASVNGATSGDGETDWTRASLSDLTAHIESTHHAYLKEELPRLAFLVHKVLRAHGDNHPELQQLAEVFDGFKPDMESHMVKEESVLFPYCRVLDVSKTLPHFHCGTVHNPIEVMEAEHEAAAAALEQMEDLTSGFVPPEDACNTYRVMLDGLARLESDTHRHVHKENSILFPRAAALEDRLRQNAQS